LGTTCTGGVMTITKKNLKTMAQRLAIAADAALVEAGRSAERRQRARAVKTTLKKVGRMALVAGAAVATVAAARAVARRRGT
jgi:hypothetical protein